MGNGGSALADVDTRFVLGKTGVLYGATSGLGVGIASELARAGLARLWIVCRSEDAGQRLQQHLKASDFSKAMDVHLVVADGQSMKAMLSAGRQIAEQAREVHLLWLNTATICGSPMLTEEGLEWTFAVNHMSFCALTAALLPAVVRSAPARILITSSEAAQACQWKLDWDNLQGEKGIDGAKTGFMAYAQSKTMNVMYTVELAKRLQALGHDAVTVNAFHPGAVKSNLGNDVNPCLASVIKTLFAYAFRSPEQAARIGMLLAGAVDLQRTSGCFFSNVEMPEAQPLQGECADAEARTRLWELSEKLLGEPLLGSLES